MLFVLLCATTLAATYAQGPVDYRGGPYYYDETPKPFSFSYNAPLEDGGQSSRTEAGDANGVVQGSYTLNNDEGHFRIVDYIADKGGFRATVRTNEPGTESKSPADVVMQSEAVPYQYVPRARRPIYNAAGLSPSIVPAAPIPAIEPAEIPEPLLPPVRRPAYRRPGPYARPAPVRYAFGRN